MRDRRSRPSSFHPIAGISSSSTYGSSPTAPDPRVATYSIVACDLEAEQWGVAVQSKFLAVGSVVPWAEPNVGAIATQAYANPRYGPEGLALLRTGRSAEEVVEQIDPYKNAGATRIILPYVAASDDVVGEMKSFINYWNPATTGLRT